MAMTTDRARGALLGLAIGDALGAQHEFDPRGAKVDRFTGGGPWDLKPGQWTDDTSMALCLALSLIERKGFDANDQMARYVQWYKHGYMSSTGECFDIGGTTRRALDRYIETGDPWQGRSHPTNQANGCIMRLVPIPMWLHAETESAVTYYSRKSALTTHGGPQCTHATDLFGLMLHAALNGKSKREILAMGAGSHYCDEVYAIAQGEYMKKLEGEIRGTGYVIDCLEAALWCFEKTDSFDAAIKRAIYLGDDTDTTAAVCGQLAGAFYGIDGIPFRWKIGVHQGKMIVGLADQLALYHAGHEHDH